MSLILPYRLKDPDALLHLSFAMAAPKARSPMPKPSNLQIATHSVELRWACLVLITSGSLRLPCGQCLHLLWVYSIPIVSFFPINCIHVSFVGNSLAFVRAPTAVCRFFPGFISGIDHLKIVLHPLWQIGLASLVSISPVTFSFIEHVALSKSPLGLSGVVSRSLLLKVSNPNPFMWIFVIDFGMVLVGCLNLSNHVCGDSYLPCIEVVSRQVLTCYVAKDFVPFICISIYGFVDVAWEVQSLFRAELPLLGTRRQFLFPKFPLDLSGLDDQASPVLQGSSSRLMVSSVFVAELVTLWVALDAVTQEAIGIVLFRSVLVSFVEMYLQSISSLTFIWWTFKQLLLCYLVFPLCFGCISSSFHRV